jgi:hypothetical protein
MQHPSCIMPRFPASKRVSSRFLLPSSSPADLALPGIAGIVFHGTWSILITAQVATIGLPDDCPQRSWASSSILWLLASFVLTTALQVWVTAASLRGEELATWQYD